MSDTDPSRMTRAADSRNPEWPNVPENSADIDAQIRADVHSALIGFQGGGSHALTISVRDGIVTLSGKLDADDKRRVVDAVRSVPSVKDVRDELRS